MFWCSLRSLISSGEQRRGNEWSTPTPPVTTVKNKHANKQTNKQTNKERKKERKKETNTRSNKQKTKQSKANNSQPINDQQRKKTIPNQYNLFKPYQLFNVKCPIALQDKSSFFKTCQCPVRSADQLGEQKGDRHIVKFVEAIIGCGCGVTQVMITLKILKIYNHRWLRKSCVKLCRSASIWMFGAWRVEIPQIIWFTWLDKKTHRKGGF